MMQSWTYTYLRAKALYFSSFGKFQQRETKFNDKNEMGKIILHIKFTLFLPNHTGDMRIIALFYNLLFY
jgi:hypothetical protein